MSLRDEAITHMAQAVWPNDYKMTPLVTTELVEAHLDALLDFLTDHAKEWDEESFSLFAWKPKDDPPKLGALYHVAALRGTTEEQ